MSDIYIPGVKSRFNTEGIIEDLMKVERIPRDRAEQQVETLKTQKGQWQEIGRRVTALRESARSMYSFQNPFSDRSVRSSDESILTATATRTAMEQEKSFVVKQIAKADKFLSNPLSSSFQVEAGTYTFKVGENEITVNYRGGNLKDFAEVVNRRGKGVIQASVMAVEKGTQSLLIASQITGEENKLSFSGAAEELVRRIGLGENEESPTPSLPDKVEVQKPALAVAAGQKHTIAFPETAQQLSAEKGIQLSFETSTKVTPPSKEPEAAPPSGPAIPGAGSVSFGGITIDNDASSVPLPEWTAPVTPQRVDDMGMLSLVFTDGSAAALPLIQDSAGFAPGKINLDEIAAGRSIASMELVNNNTHRDLSIRNIEVVNTAPKPPFKPNNALGKAQDAIIVMDGIEIKRPSNEIDDLVPGLKLTAKAPSEREVTLTVEPDREGIKEAIVTLVGNYNRLMGELNVLTRNDDKVIQELNYLSKDEQDEMRKRLGAFAGDSMLTQFRNNLQQAVTNSYFTEAGPELSMLAQIGIGTDVRRSGASAGYDPSRLRGYLEIDEKALDAALQRDLRPIQQLFGFDTDGDLIVDSGVSYTMDSYAKPYVEIGGIVSLKTGSIDSKINQEERHIATLDRQLAAKEASLRRQYGAMESAYSRMEKMGTSLDNFSKQANAINNSRR
jgi:flagellar hook-associated protein 2